MKFLYVASLLTTAVLFTTIPRTSSAAITCTTSTCQTFTQTANGSDANQIVAVSIPPGVSQVSLYAKGGDANGNDFNQGYTVVSGGGGACAYYYDYSNNSYQYLLCVGGGGGGGCAYEGYNDDPSFTLCTHGPGSSSGPGAGGSTYGDGVGKSGRSFYLYPAYKNGSGAHGSELTYGSGWSGDGGGPGHGGYASPWGRTGGGGGGDIFSSAGYGAYANTFYTFGGYLLGGAGGGDSQYGAGGGGGYGGGGGGMGYSGGGGGSSYFHPSLSGPDQNGFVSIPTSALSSSGGRQLILLAAGKGGANIYSSLFPGYGFPAGSGTITSSYLCSPRSGTSCASTANSCGDVSYGTYDCSENCSATTAPDERTYVYGCPGGTGTLGYPSACPTACGTAISTQTQVCSGGNGYCEGSPSTRICAATASCCVSSYGSSCSLTSSGNVCGQTTTANTGTYNCNGTCAGTAPSPPPNSNCSYTLSVNTAGNGAGTVTSNPAGISCGTDCSESYTYNSSVILTATPATGSSFSGWSGTGCGSTVTINENRTCTATFTNDPPSIGTVTINAPGSPPLVNTIRETPFEYTITVSGSDEEGAPKVHALQILINRDGGNAGQLRGYLLWNEGSTSDWAPNAKPGSTTSCAGVGGTAIVFKDTNTNYGHDHLNLASCSVSDSGNTRTVSFVVTFNSSYISPATGNDISGIIFDYLWNYDGWQNFDLNFRLVPPVGASCRAVTNTCAYIPAPSTCTPSSTGYTSDTYRWEITSLSGGAGAYDSTGTYDYEWLSTGGPSGDGTVTNATRSNASRSLSYASEGSKTSSLKVRSAGSPYSTFTCASASVLPIPDLIPTSDTATIHTPSHGGAGNTRGMAGEPQSFSASISNSGPKATGPAANIPSVFQVRNSNAAGAAPGGTTIARVPTNIVASLALSASAAVSASYTFSGSTVADHGTIYFIRVCANKDTAGDPVVLEAPDDNNCGADAKITVLPPLSASCSATCPDSQTSGTCYTTSTVNWNLTALSGGSPPYSYSWMGGPTDSGTGNNSFSKSGTLPDASAASRATASVSKKYAVPSPPNKTAAVSITSLGVTKSLACTSLFMEGIADLTAE